ncbi:hypothetical protein PUN28_012963 [Cardiocondyla obscurior]|uniref:Uncharacterized protein n=1 Tax=Cardiocondyla obscurior TaxID=286306 RepID=A0AAW2FB80_9HYME
MIFDVSPDICTHSCYNRNLQENPRENILSLLVVEFTLIYSCLRVSGRRRSPTSAVEEANIERELNGSFCISICESIRVSRETFPSVDNPLR